MDRDQQNVAELQPPLPVIPSFHHSTSSLKHLGPQASGSAQALGDAGQGLELEMAAFEPVRRPMR
jgi:hypothetical protein